MLYVRVVGEFSRPRECGTETETESGSGHNTSVDAF